MSGTLNLRLQNVKVIFTSATKLNENDKEYNKIFIRGNVDVCKMTKGSLGSVVVQVAVNILKQFSNLEPRCSYDKGYYHITNFPAADSSLLPYNFLGILGGIETTIAIKAKLSNTKPLVNIFSFKLIFVV